MFFRGVGFIFAVVRMLVNRTRGPYRGVSSTLFWPKDPVRRGRRRVYVRRRRMVF